MGIHFACECGRAFSVRSERAGKTLTCPGCGKRLTVPPADRVRRKQRRAEARQSRAYRESPDEEGILGAYSPEDLAAAGLLDQGGEPVPQRSELTPTDSDPGTETFDRTDPRLGPQDFDELDAAGPADGPSLMSPQERHRRARAQMAANRERRRIAKEGGRTPRRTRRRAAKPDTAAPRGRSRRWWLVRLAVLIAVLVGLVVAYPDSRSTVRSWLDGGARDAAAVAQNDRGVKLEEANRLPEAIAAFQEALRVKPDLFEAHYNLGNALDASNRYAESLESFRKAVALNKYHAGASFGLGAALYKTGQPEEALYQLEDALLLDPNHAEAHLYKSYALNKLERYEEAWTALERAHELGAHFNATYMRRLQRALGREPT